MKLQSVEGVAKIYCVALLRNGIFMTTVIELSWFNFHPCHITAPLDI